LLEGAPPVFEQQACHGRVCLVLHLEQTGTASMLNVKTPRCPQKASSSAGTSLEWHSFRERTKRAKGSQTPAHPKLINRLRSRCPTVRRVIQNVADVDDIHLPPQAFVGGVYGYYPSVPAEPRMQINSVNALPGCRF